MRAKVSGRECLDYEDNDHADGSWNGVRAPSVFSRSPSVVLELIAFDLGS